MGGQSSSNIDIDPKVAYKEQNLKLKEINEKKTTNCW